MSGRHINLTSSSLTSDQAERQCPWHSCFILQAPMPGEVGAIDFMEGALKTFPGHSFSERWDVHGSVPNELHSNMLEYHFRVCAEGDGSVYVINTRDMILYCLDVAGRQWGNGIQIDTTYSAQFAAMAYSNGSLYISGGRAISGKETYETMLSLMVNRDISHILVQQEPGMAYARCEHQMACVDGNVMVCGGRDGQSMLATCELFCPSTRTWEQLTWDTEARCSPGMVSTPNGLYVLGGILGYNSILGRYDLSDAVSLYDWKTQQWETTNQLPRPLAHVKGIYKDGSLWVLAAGKKICKRVLNYSETFHITNVGHVLEYNVNRQTWISHADGAGGAPGNDVFLFSL